MSHAHLYNHLHMPLVGTWDATAYKNKYRSHSLRGSFSSCQFHRPVHWKYTEKARGRGGVCFIRKKKRHQGGTKEVTCPSTQFSRHLFVSSLSTKQVTFYEVVTTRVCIHSVISFLLFCFYALFSSFFQLNDK